VPYALRKKRKKKKEKKKKKKGLGAGPLEYQFLQPRGCHTNPFRTLSLCFRVINKTPGLISHNNFVKKMFVLQPLR
jgi:hypothetical protein